MVFKTKQRKRNSEKIENKYEFKRERATRYYTQKPQLGKNYWWGGERGLKRLRRSSLLLTVMMNYCIISWLECSPGSCTPLIGWQHSSDLSRTQSRSSR